MFQRRGIILVVSGPSGSGKSTLKQALMAHDVRLVFSVSATTRPPRPGEQDGVDYFFLSEEDFDRHIDKGEFLEHTTLFGHRYGTLRPPVEHTLSQGCDMIFDVSAQGAHALKVAFPLETVRVLILPPSLEVLEQRLKGRSNGVSSAANLQQRFEEARSEIQHGLDYEYVIMNMDAAQATRELGAIVQAERLKMTRQTHLQQWLHEHVIGMNFSPPPVSS